MAEKQSNELSERELEVLTLVATGASNKEIAQKLFISANTVKVHIRNIFAKVGVSSRTEAMLWMLKNNPALPHPDSIPPSSGQVENSQTLYPIPISVAEPKQKTKPPAGRIFILAVLLVLSVVSMAIGGPTLLASVAPVTAVGTDAPVVTPSVSRWRAVTSLPSPRSGFAVAAYENSFYLISGEGEEGITGLVERYNFTNSTYETIATKPVPVADAGAVVIGGEIYVPGGRLASGLPTATLEVYNPRQNRWFKRASLPAALSGYALAAFEGRLYVFGGWDGEAYRDSVYLYEPAADTWKEVTAMPTARAFAGAAAVGGKIHVVGGFDGNGALDVNEVYIPEQETLGQNPWSIANAMPDSRYAMGITNVADFIQVVGGEGGRERGEFFAAISYSVSEDEWLLLEAPRGRLGSYLGAGAFGGEIYVFGGKVDDQVVDQNLVYQFLYTLSIPVIIK
jgi:DNA-binding CsgD family transcriptional regulator